MWTGRLPQSSSSQRKEINKYSNIQSIKNLCQDTALVSLTSSSPAMRLLWWGPPRRHGKRYLLLYSVSHCMASTYGVVSGMSLCCPHTRTHTQVQINRGVVSLSLSMHVVLPYSRKSHAYPILGDPLAMLPKSVGRKKS